MEPAHCDLDARVAEGQCDVERAGILVGLDAGQRDESKIVVTSEPGN